MERISYTDLYQKVVDSMPVKKTKYGSITAVKATTQEEYDLAYKMWTAGHGTYYSPNPYIEGRYSGPDWYIIKEDEYDVGHGHWYEYSIISLTKIKEDFQKYCDSFEKAED